MVSARSFTLLRESIVLALPDVTFAVRVSRQLRHQGWEVYLAASGIDARRLSAALQPQLVVLDTDLPDESGWLSCAKLTCLGPGHKVFLLSSRTSARRAALARFVGALALVSSAAGGAAVAEQVHAAALQEPETLEHPCEHAAG
ncbi:MAG TPA: response regulator [Gemmataceae bacterium]|nr:response regulator [Gemmataceae bacterium]